jgi:hypothetical protein
LNLHKPIEKTHLFTHIKTISNPQQILHDLCSQDALCIRMKFRSFRNSLEDVSDMFRSLRQVDRPRAIH